MSADQHPPDGTSSVEDVDRIAERFKPAWEVDDDAPDGGPHAPDLANVPTTRAFERVPEAPLAAPDAQRAFVPVPVASPPIESGQTPSASAASTASIAHANTPNSTYYAPAPTQPPATMTGRVPEPVTEVTPRAARFSQDSRQDTPSATPAAAVLGTATSALEAQTSADGQSLSGTQLPAANAESVDMASTDGEGDIVDFGLTRGRWRPRHVVPLVVVLGAASLGLLLLLRQPPRSLEPVQAAPAHLAPNAPAGLAADPLPAPPDPRNEPAPPEGRAAIAAPRAEPSPEPARESTARTSPAASAANSGTPPPLAAAAVRAAKPKEQAPSSTVFLHRPSQSAGPLKPAAPPQKPTPPTKPGGIVREVPF